MSFAHGANDVGNAIAPLSAVMITLKEGIGSLGQQVSPLVLVIGAVGIVAGLATFGYKVMATIGGSITGVVPTRGFAAEFGAATVVLVCSKMGLPMSTSHTIVGAVVAIGLLRGLQAVNLKMCREVFLGWLITVPASAVIAAVLYWVMKWIWVAAT
jgi:phosphate/sulfate permease